MCTACVCSHVALAAECRLADATMVQAPHTCSPADAAGTCRYRAPECLLTDGYYSYKMDMWGVGCVFFEIVALFPLFPGANEADQLAKIHTVLGAPPPETLAKFRHRSEHTIAATSGSRTGTGIATLIPHCSPACIDLIEKLLHYDPEERLSARQALKHPYFKDLRCVPSLPRRLRGWPVALHACAHSRVAPPGWRLQARCTRASGRGSLLTVRGLQGEGAVGGAHEASS
jgi:serine/threonine protein kinase